jgi:tape measure domain-containing protein
MAGRNTVEILLSAQDRASGPIARTMGTLKSASGGAMTAVKAGAAVAVGAIATLTGVVAKVGVSYNAMAENSQVAWKTLLGTQEKAKKMFSDIANFAKTTQFDTASVDAMAKYMHNAGYAGKDLFDQLTKIADVSGAFNIPADSAQELARQMSQVVQAGVAYTEDLNILQDRGVPIYQAIAKELGVDVGAVKMLASQGKLSSDVYMKAFDSISASVKGASQAQSETFTGMISTLKDQLSILAGALAKPLFEKLKAGLDKLLPAMDALVSYASGDMKGFTTSMDKTFGAGAGQKLLGFANGLKTAADGVKTAIGKIKEAMGGISEVFKGNAGGGISMLSRVGLSPEAVAAVVTATEKVKGAISILAGAFDILKGDSIGGITIMTKLGLSPETITKVVQVVNGIKGAITGYFDYLKNLFSGSSGLGESFGKIFVTAKSIIMPIVSEIVSFVKEKFGMIKQFWDENGAMIIQAIKNVWAIIAGIFQAVAPVILFILKMLWDTVAGLISGALNIIMGLIKIFAGLFTGNFSKMWEGVKQLFKGAIEFIWNWLNLLMFGRILGGIKAFVVKGAEAFGSFLTKAVGVFKNLDTAIGGVVKTMISKVLGFFKNLYTEGSRIFGTLKTFGANTFSALWAAIKGVVSSMVSGVKSKFLDIVTGAKFHMQGLLSTAKSIFNSIKSAITNPIETAKNTISGIISKIKGLFSGIKVSIPLPHFHLNTTTKSIMGKQFTFPTGVDVDWYDKGGVFTGPQIIGVGERRPEVVGALSDIKKYVKEAINEMGINGTANAAGPQYAVINIDGRQVMLATINYINDELALRKKRW